MKTHPAQVGDQLPSSLPLGSDLEPPRVENAFWLQVLVQESLMHLRKLLLSQGEYSEVEVWVQEGMAL